MMTLRRLAAEQPTLPTRTTWYLTDLGEVRGKQELFTRQSPQKLKVLREHALIESTISSNRIEGVEVDQSRVGRLIFGKPALRDHDEEEVRGYCEPAESSGPADLPWAWAGWEREKSPQIGITQLFGYSIRY
jgi:hypothetical protein